MRMNFRVVYLDGRKVETHTIPFDIAAFERQYDTSVAAFADTKSMPKMHWVWYLAWSALHRTRQEPRAFDEFLADVEDIEQLADVPAPVPFVPTPTPEASPPSPYEPESPPST